VSRDGTLVHHTDQRTSGATSLRSRSSRTSVFYTTSAARRSGESLNAMKSEARSTESRICAVDDHSAIAVSPLFIVRSEYCHCALERRLCASLDVPISNILEP
jgi:hypothetical protein